MDEPSPERQRVLVVEDDSVTAHDVGSILDRPGFEVVGVAANREDVERIAAETPIDIALLDVRLEELDDGIAIADHLLRAHGVSPVFVTGYSEEAVFSRIDRGDTVGYLRKPFSESELVTCLEEASERTRSRRQLLGQLPSVEAFAGEMENPVVVTDRDGRLRYGNRAAQEQFGWDPARMMGAPLDESLQVVPAGSEQPGSSGDPREVAVEMLPDRSWEGQERVTSIQSERGDLLGTIHHFSLPGPDSAGPEIQPQPSGSASSSPEPSPPMRSSALRKLEEISKDPAFRELIRTPAESNSESPEAPPDPVDVPPPASAPPASPLDHLDDPILRLLENGSVELCNDAARTVFGDPTPSATLSSLFESSDCEEVESGLRRPLEDGRKHHFRFRDSRRERHYEVRAYRVEGGVLALFSDLAAAPSDTAESVRQQRLEGLGLLARGFAHDFNNHLTTITGNIALARERHTEDEQLHQMLTEAQSAATRATGLVQQLMTFAQGGRPIRKDTRIADLVRRILTDHRLRHPEIRFQFQGADVDLVAHVDPAQVSRLLENLVANSTEAMSEGGILIVRCGRIPPERVAELRPGHTAAEEEHLLIEVIDTGHGMDEEALDQVFEPYFTTRREDNASGIGLTVCESIARAHGGFVQLQSKEGKGTIATFCAPLGQRTDVDTSDSSLAEPDLESPIPPLETPQFQLESGDNILVGTRILILEDDAPIRRLMAATLRRAGHEVVETRDGHETVEVYRDAMDRGAKFHLLICDLTIENGMGGVETMRQLTRLDPSILAIVSSGYSDAPAMSSPASFGFRGVLPKPYAPSELRAAVHRILTTYGIIT